MNVSSATSGAIYRPQPQDQKPAARESQAEEAAETPAQEAAEHDGGLDIKA